LKIPNFMSFFSCRSSKSAGGDVQTQAIVLVLLSRVLVIDS